MRQVLNAGGRLSAEGSVAIYLEALEQVRHSAQAALATIEAIITWPTDFTRWHAQNIASGIAEEAVRLHGAEFATAIRAVAEPRGAVVADRL